MPVGTQQRGRSQSQRMEPQGTPNRRVSLRKQVSSSRQLGTSQVQSRGRPLSSDAHSSSSRRAYSLSQHRSTSKTPPHRNTLIDKQYARSVQSDNDLGSVSSDSNLNTHERRQPARSSRSERSFRDDSPGKKPSISKGSNSKLSSERVVVIQRVVEELRKHLNDAKRHIKLTQAVHEFDHWDDARHGAELLFGAANVLSMALTLAKNDDEVRMVCASLEMVFRASQKQVSDAYDAIQVSIVPWLLGVTTKAEEGKLKYASDIILDIAKIFYYWSRIPKLRSSLARHPGMVEMLTRVSSLSGADAKEVRMSLISNLANADENKALLLQTNGFLESILRTAVIDASEKVKECASSTLMDLASCPDNQIQMANSDRVLATLVKLAVTETISETREAAISGLQNLAFCYSVRLRLITFSNGVVLDALRKTLSSDFNVKARRRAAGALTNLACEETAEFMGNHKGLLEALAVVASKDENSDVQGRAAMALAKISSGITCHMSCYKSLMDALVVASLSNAATSVSHVLRVKAREPENRASMARHAGVIDTLCDICVSSDNTVKDRENAMRALMHLTNEDTNREIMCQRTVLDALMVGANTEGTKWTAFFESAIVALERLATEPNNRPVMARFRGMLVTIAKVTEKEQLLEDAGTEANHERLAKPLLMSLLLAL